MDDADKTPLGEDKTSGPADLLARIAEQRKSDLSGRCRVVATGIIAVAWGVLAGESKLRTPLAGIAVEFVITAAALAVLVFLLDYAQSLLEYLDAKWSGGRLLGPGGHFMFIGKQVLTFIAGTAILAAAAFLVLQPSAAASESIRWTSLWTGTVSTAESPSEKRQSKLYMSDPDAYTGWVTANYDGKTTCKGPLNRGSLILMCASSDFRLRLDGIVEGQGNGRVYHGTWVLFESERRGGFEYQFRKSVSLP